MYLSTKYSCPALLGSIVVTRGATEADVKTRISKARAAFHIVRNVWKSRVIGKTTKIRLFNNLMSSLCCYTELKHGEWTIPHWKGSRLLNQCLRKILGLQWMDEVSNKERTDQVQIEISILKRRWGWFGHTLRKPNSNVTSQALTGNPQSRRKRGRSRSTCRRDLQADIP